jgi:hypothetical protein
MSIIIAVRFRPVDSSNRPSATASEEATRRWTERLSRHPGVLDFHFGGPTGPAPVERPDALSEGADVQPIDLVTEWESIEHANTLFDNSELFCDLNGLVAGAPTVTVGEVKR